MVDGTVRRNDLESLKQELSKSAPIYHNLDLRQLTTSPKGIKYILPYSREHFVSLHKNELGNKGFQDLENFLESLVNTFETPQIRMELQTKTLARSLLSFFGLLLSLFLLWSRAHSALFRVDSMSICVCIFVRLLEATV